ncbi:uncharacterized protein LOC116655817 [Drosophila ananassae]|uniref:uncharacterized protein LOC116655817 n=1 Tax=Drosophila ananassae TaxID=7217 RepID=UPI0013A5D533|nr:uncharacterized protein LOC116655817 [Drosophila ananassae]
MSKYNNDTDTTNNQRLAQPEELLNSSNNDSSDSSDIEISRSSKLRRRSSRNTSFHYPALPMHVVGHNSSIIPEIPSTARDVTLKSAQIIADSSDSEFHISNESSNDEPPKKSITFTGRPLIKTDLDFIRRQRKRRQTQKKVIYKD